jgi:hypothetical protein
LIRRRGATFRRAQRSKAVRKLLRSIELIPVGDEASHPETAVKKEPLQSRTRTKECRDLVVPFLFGQKSISVLPLAMQTLSR